MTSHKKYSAEFKRQAVELAKTSGKSHGALERELGITAGLLCKWRDRYQVMTKGSQNSLEPSDFEAAKSEIKRLRRELANVEEEREILKKTINIFSRKSA